jgi:hypothetical protein
MIYHRKYLVSILLAVSPLTNSGFSYAQVRNTNEIQQFIQLKYNQSDIAQIKGNLADATAHLTKNSKIWSKFREDMGVWQPLEIIFWFSEKRLLRVLKSKAIPPKF